VNGTNIVLTLEQQTCMPSSTEACSALCQSPQPKCTIPPLSAGTYTIDFGAGVHSPDAPVRTLVVADGATETSCETGRANEPPAPISAKDFPQTCTVDDDCALIAEGDVCTPCKCATAAISKSALASYESTLRERQALCTVSAADACAPCKALPPRCNAGTCGVVQAL
jgi:hypothetical protein